MKPTSRNVGYWQKLEEFSQRVPYYLSRQSETIELSKKAEKTLQTLNIERKFNLAVSGRFKQGKSTLINALVGKTLPIVGAAPTTATITFLDYGEELDESYFHVRWRNLNKADSTLPMSQIENFMGDNQQGKDATALYLKIHSEFLKGVRLVDTPGTGNVSKDHQGTVDSYFDRITPEEATIIESEKADALIHVLPNISRTEDQDALNQFGQMTRPFGASAYNSMGVIQFWESALATSEPLTIDLMQRSRDKAQLFKQQLGGHISEVLPVSGLLYLASISVSSACFQDIINLIKDKNTAEANKFISFHPKLEREAVYNDIQKYMSVEADSTKFTGSLSILRTALWATQFYEIRSGDELSNKLKELSGIDYLKDVLQQQFFSIADLIKAGAILSKASAPCEKALHILRQKRDESKYLAQESDAALASLSGMKNIKNNNPSGTKNKLESYIHKMQILARNESNRLDKTCQEFEEIHREVKADFETIVHEIDCLKRLDNDASIKHLMDEVDLMELRYLFGQYGVDICERLNFNDASNITGLIDRAWELKMKWQTQGLLPRAMKDAINDRLDNILDELEA